jgi:Tol biopolymer transport system component
MAPSRILLLTLALAVAGCGGGSSGSAPSQPLAFTVNDNGWGEIWLMDESGKARKQLTAARPEGSEAAGNSSPSWSPDRTRIAYTGTGDGVLQDPSYDEIYAMDGDGSHVDQLTKNHVPDFSPDWSDDGKRIVFSRGAGLAAETPTASLYVMNADGSDQRELYRGKGVLLVTPDWSPDGKRIVFARIAYPEGRPIPSVWVMNSDGTGARKIASGASDPAWSPDGEHIAMATGRDGFGQTCFGGCQPNDEIYVVDPNGKSPKRLTKDKGEDTSPAWSPDGKEIAFVSDRTSREQSNDIYVVDATGGAARRITNNFVLDLEPDWK